jgi:hypothetical protein
MIDPKKQYRTRYGREVRIYAVDGGGHKPIHGAIREGDGWFLTSWLYTGAGAIDCNSLIEMKPRIQREVWVNVYPAWLQSDVMYQSKKAADDGAAPDRIACVKVVIDCEEGEGL